MTDDMHANENEFAGGYNDVLENWTFQKPPRCPGKNVAQ